MKARQPTAVSGILFFSSVLLLTAAALPEKKVGVADSGQQKVEDKQNQSVSNQGGNDLPSKKVWTADSGQQKVEGQQSRSVSNNTDDELQNKRVGTGYSGQQETEGKKKAIYSD